ncbi:MAG: T9SS type A sorting domain-containing protein [Saprospiraceae bacterium]
MKKNLYIIALIFCGLNLNAQITINSSVLPTIGDTTKVISQNNAGAAGITAAGENQSWDLSNLIVGSVQQTIFLSPTEGTQVAAFPGATLLTIAGANETYYKVENGRLFNLGYSGIDPAGLGLQIKAVYNPALQEIKTPLTYGSELAYSSKLVLPFGYDQLPDTLVALIPIQFDSIRLKLQTDISDVVDAWGQMTTPSGTFDVLRTTRKTISTTGLEVKVGVFPWFDVSALIPIPGLAGTTHSTSYLYQTNGIKSPIAEITSDSAGTTALRTTYYANDVISATNNLPKGKSAISIFPNPSYGEVNFNLTGLTAGRYTIKIFNIVGKEILAVSDFVHGNGVILADLSAFAKGTYIYTLLDESNQVIATKRLMVVTP